MKQKNTKTNPLNDLGLLIVNPFFGNSSIKMRLHIIKFEITAR